MKNKYPIFVPTKSRFNNPLTIRALQKIGADFKIVIEDQEYSQYEKLVNKDQIIILPHKDRGLTATRNWIWNYVQSEGYERFWTFDDNITRFHRINHNIKWRAETTTFLRALEDFTDRYENAVITGMNYHFLAPRKQKFPPFYLNTRIYSNMLIKTNILDQNGRFFRNECFYNDDTDLCLRILKAGYCTVLFNAFLIRKEQTMTIKGGMTDYYEKTNKRMEFAKELQEKHPDVVRIVWRYNRWHHEVDYSQFKANKLIKKANIEIPQGINNYGMKLIKLDNEQKINS